MSDFVDNFVDRAEIVWIGWRNILGGRPFQFLGLMLGLLTVVVAFAIVISQQAQNTTTLGEIKAEFCSGQETNLENTRLCQDLLDQLLLDPTPEQKQEFRRIVLGGDN